MGAAAQGCDLTRRAAYVTCASLTRCLETAMAWVLGDPATLKHYPAKRLFRRPDVFSRIKQGTISELRSRLAILKRVEELRQGKAIGPPLRVTSV